MYVPDFLASCDWQTLNDIYRSSKSIGDISREISTYYNDLFTKEDPEKPQIEGLVWDPISSQYSVLLERPFEEDEIRRVVLDRDKASAP